MMFDFYAHEAEEIANKYSEREIFIGLRWRTRRLPSYAVIAFESIADRAIMLKRKSANGNKP